MPRLLDQNGAVEDVWTRADTPDDGKTILPLAALETAGSRPASITGVHIDNDVDVRGLAGILDRVSLISVAFPAFADGRGFSQGRTLRGMGYAGRLRASGPVIADQMEYLIACGFDEIEVPDGVHARQPNDQWLRAAGLVTMGYQHGYGGRTSILEARRTTRVIP